MSDPLTLTDEYVYRVAPDGKSAQAALDLIRRNAFRQLRMSDDGTQLEGLCQGSDPKPYPVKVNLENPNRPQTGCTCFSYKHPCKHAVGLLFLAARSPEVFERTAGAPPPRARQKKVTLETTTARKAPVEKGTAPADMGEAFLQAILADPEDDAPRLIYADWLEENGGPKEQDRAEFIRVQIALARAAEDDPNAKALRQRETELWEAHQEEWLETIPPHLRRKRIRFHRGFLEELHLPPGSWAKHGHKLFGRHPIYRVRLSGTVNRHETGALAVIPHLARVRVLAMENCQFHEPMKALQILFDTPFLSGLTRLLLRKSGFSTREMSLLAASPLLARLRVLDLSDNEVGPKGAQQLAESPHAVNLRELLLANNPVGDAGAKALAASPHLDGLTCLDLRGVELATAAQVALQQRFGDRVLLD